jgi:photosystem II stability/assembly factor-like uncharacterized protein
MPVKDVSFVNNLQGFGLGLPSDEGALLYTADGGQSWKSFNSLTQDYLPLRLSFIDENNGWVLADESAGSNKPVIIKTPDGGRTWTSHLLPGGINGNTIEPLGNQPMQFTDESHGWILSAHGLLKTVDGGKTWTWQ